MRQIITDGVTYKLEYQSENDRRQDLTAMINKGNHKSVSDKHNEPTLLKNYEKEVHNG